eukprot:8682800-Pyramimonas_sp.AAC.1
MLIEDGPRTALAHHTSETQGRDEKNHLDFIVSVFDNMPNPFFCLWNLKWVPDVPEELQGPMLEARQRAPNACESSSLHV